MKNTRFKRFIDFVEWYMKNGGMPLTAEQIEKTFKKF